MAYRINAYSDFMQQQSEIRSQRQFNLMQETSQRYVQTLQRNIDQLRSNSSYSPSVESSTDCGCRFTAWTIAQSIVFVIVLPSTGCTCTPNVATAIAGSILGCFGITTGIGCCCYDPIKSSLSKATCCCCSSSRNSSLDAFESAPIFPKMQIEPEKITAESGADKAPNASVVHSSPVHRVEPATVTIPSSVAPQQLNRVIETGCLTTLMHVQPGVDRGDVTRLIPLTGNLFVSQSPYCIKLWDLSTRECIQTILDEEYPASLRKKYIGAIAALPDGLLAYGGAGGLDGPSEKLGQVEVPSHIKIWDISQRRCVRTLNSPDNVFDLIALPGNRLASSSSKSICIWDLSTGECLNTLRGYGLSHPSALTPIDNNLLAVICNGGIIQLWDTTEGLNALWNTLSGGHVKKTLHPKGEQFWSVEDMVKLDNNRLATLSTSNIRVWDISTGECIRILSANLMDGSKIVPLTANRLAIGYGRMIEIWDVSTGVCLKKLNGHTKILSLAQVADDVLASGDWDGVIKLWKV